MGNGTAARTIATVRERLDTANGLRPDPGDPHAAAAAWGPPGSGRQMSWWVTAGQRPACRGEVRCSGTMPYAAIWAQVPTPFVRLAVRAVLWWAKDADASPKIGNHQKGNRR
jgi:hypothetical protein